MPISLNLWATWCSPCRKEMPELQRLLPDFKASGIELVGVSIDQDASRDQRSRRLRKGWGFPTRST